MPQILLFVFWFVLFGLNCFIGFGVVICLRWCLVLFVGYCLQLDFLSGLVLTFDFVSWFFNFGFSGLVVSSLVLCYFGHLGGKLWCLGLV